MCPHLSFPSRPSSFALRWSEAGEEDDGGAEAEAGGGLGAGATTADADPAAAIASVRGGAAAVAIAALPLATAGALVERLHDAGFRLLCFWGDSTM